MIRRRNENRPNQCYHFRLIINCEDRDFAPKSFLRKKFKVHQNYVPAFHGDLRCDESITYTTHGDFSFLDNLVPLLERWQAPLSIALYAPGEDFDSTIASILYLRNCIPEAAIIVQLATFHLFYENKHRPKKLPPFNYNLEVNFVCPDVPPYTLNSTTDKMYRTKMNLTYPVNFARNLARSAALTHYVLSSDIEFYPSVNLVDDFFEMLRTANTFLVSENK